MLDHKLSKTAILETSVS